ncbi:MAG: hypothetical protein FWG09_07100, partial [Synergistaceae bacterium]|nr:hypothetical protein [Synergistaceae bacterium]
YFHDVTAQMRGFLERLIYPYLSFERFGQSNAPKALFSAFIYTMNVKEDRMAASNYHAHLSAIEYFLQIAFKHKPERVCAFNTYQYENYGDFKVSAWDERDKAAYREKQFPIDCRNAFEAGKRMADKIQAIDNILISNRT